MENLEHKDDTLDTAKMQTEKDNKALEEELEKQDKNTGGLDGKAKESAVIQTMAGNDISRLVATIPGEEQDTFNAQAKPIKADFDARTAAVLEDDTKKPAEKRKELIALYAEFKEKIEELQGRIVGPEGAQRAREAEQGKQEAKQAKDATEQFHTARKEAQQRLALEAINKERVYAKTAEREHMAQENKERKQSSAGADDAMKLA